MYHTMTFEVKSKDPLYDYCNSITKATNNLKNAALFRIRQVLTMVEKPANEMTANELAVYNEIQNALPLMGNEYHMPAKGKPFLSYSFMNALFRATNNPDFFCDNLPNQTAQQTLKEVVKAMKGFYASSRAYAQNPNSFTGKPRLPGYSKRGGNHTAVITNQDCVIYYKMDKNGKEINGNKLSIEEKANAWKNVKLPLTKQRLDIGKAPVNGRLQQVTITPTHGIFVIALVFDDEKADPMPKPVDRICAIDVGVNNFAAITNNSGLPCLLFKGGAIKSINQYYNKEMAKIVSEQTKGTTDKFHPTPESEALCLWRNRRVADYIRKTANMVVQWCVANNIDTIVVGVNKFWKQNSNLGHVNNQNFVQIPFMLFRQHLSYRAQRYGINYVEQEESYTSDASFVSGDDIPVFSAETGADKVTFSGKRGPCTYKGQHKANYSAYRGIYRNQDGSYLNADLNASANIGRKAFPEKYLPGSVDFDHVEVIKHPDYKYLCASKKTQAPQVGHISKSKQRRLNKKAKSKK